MLAGMAGLTMPVLAGCAGTETTSSRVAAGRMPGLPATGPGGGIDAVIDISHLVQVSDFNLVRRHGVLAVIHKATEGGDWTDSLYAVRRTQAQQAGLLWGAYHFGTRQYPGEDQARAFLAAARPGPDTVMALDFEPNERHPANSMRLAQAEAFVRTIQAETGRLPLLYTHPNWANGVRCGRSGLSLGVAIDRHSILARCELWLADYRDTPELPMAWADRGWRLWQYCGDDSVEDSAYGTTSRGVAGVDHCDRNLFAGDTRKLYRFWGSQASV